MTDQHYPRKRFGQHFLRDTNILRKIAQLIAPQPSQHIVEIGPGEGVLTTLILPHINRLDVIEIDRDLVQHLRQIFQQQPRLHIHCQDVLKFDFTTLTPQPHTLRLIGNLPYNISSPLFFKLFSCLDYFQDLHFLLQKEVVLRMTAAVGSSNYSRLSVMTQYYCENQALFDVAPQAFYPPPKVNSTFIRMTPHQSKLIANDIALFTQVVKQAFNQRRKTLQNCLKGMISKQQLIALDIDPQYRPQQLSVNDFVRISNTL